MISKTIEDESKFIKIEFLDNGIGIDDERKQGIFQEVYDEKKGTNGMGLGLSLIKKIIELYHGKIWVEDRISEDYAKGSRFIVQIQSISSELSD